MQQLTGLDATFLAMESDSVSAHIGSVSLLRARSAAPESASATLTLERLKAVIGERLPLVPVFRRRLLTVPGGLDHPWWVDDPDVDLDHHVRETALPRGRGTSEQRLAALVATLHAPPLDRSRPLWEVYLITGLSGGRVALYSKMHHAAVDGIAGGDVLTALLDRSPEGPTPEPVSTVVAAVKARSGAATTVPGGGRRASGAEELPGGAWLLGHAVTSLLRSPVDAARVVADVARSLPAVAGSLRPFVDGLGGRDVADWLASPRLWAPPTPFNAPITAQRQWAFAAIPLSEVKAVRRGTDLTVNDVVMALTTGALRRWLVAHDALPESRLIAAVPVSVRVRHQNGTFGNHVSFMLAALPTTVTSPGDRLRATEDALRRAKAGHAAIPPTLIADLTQLTVPAIATEAWRLLFRLRTLERGAFNLIVSNVPGPTRPLYLAGSELLAWYPVSQVADGQGLNVTVTTYRGTAHFGLVACTDLVPDLDSMAGYLRDELDALLDERAVQDLMLTERSGATAGAKR